MGIVSFRLSIGDWRRTTSALTGLAFLTLTSCGQKPTDEPRPGGVAETKMAEDGPVRITLNVLPAELPFSQRATLTVEAVAEKNVTVELADYQKSVVEGEHSFEFRLRRLSQSAAMPTPDGHLKWTQQYEIEFFLPGEYELPPAKLTYSQLGPAEKDAVDPAGTAEGSRHELATEAIKVIAKATEAAQIGPEELRKIEILPPVELVDPWSKWWLVTIPAALGIAALALLAMRRRLREVELAVEVIPAHEWARRQIAALIADELIAKGLVQEFYYRISAIVRGYIERRYGVSAPEMTTEEFLAATAGDFRFAAGPATDLQAFLTACDLVKYARYRPAAGEWNDLLRTAAQFVERTRQDAERSTEQETPAIGVTS